jgi:hypothetical protein
MDLRQTSPTGTGPKVGLEVMPIDSVTLSDGHSPGERAPDPPFCVALGVIAARR